MGTRLTIVCSFVALALPAPRTRSSAARASRAAATPSPWPWDAKGADCGGTLIAPSACSRPPIASTRTPATPPSCGSSSGSPTINSAPTVLVTAVYVHPLFRADTMHYDAALLILEHPVTGVRTIEMADSSPLAGATVSAAGWGETTEHATTLPDHLRSVVLKVATKRACGHGNSKIPGGYFTRDDVRGSPGRDNCSGDSGGPLVGTSHGHTVLVGITSFGTGCARAGHPGVYTRVPSIRGWALGQIARSLPAAA